MGSDDIFRMVFVLKASIISATKIYMSFDTNIDMDSNIKIGAGGNPGVMMVCLSIESATAASLAFFLLNVVTLISSTGRGYSTPIFFVI